MSALAAGDGDGAWGFREKAAAEAVEERASALTLGWREDGVELFLDVGDHARDAFTAGGFGGFEFRPGGFEEGMKFFLLIDIELEFRTHGGCGRAGDALRGGAAEGCEAVAFHFHAEEGTCEDAHEKHGDD